MSSGTEFTRAQTPLPSDSFPGMVAQVTGGNPSSTGVYYDDSWNAALLPAGTTSCVGIAPGVEVTYFEQAAKNPHSIDSGFGLTGLPGSILQLTGNATSLVDPAQLPVDPVTCKPVYPHQYIQVNTVFEVARAAGLRTAWSDKHAAYEILNGPSGAGVQVLFAPEINSDAPVSGSSNDWTTDNALTMQYDSYKVRAVINEINGNPKAYTASGLKTVFAGAAAAAYFHVTAGNSRVPDVFGISQCGVVYTGKKAKIAEHGAANPQDRDVPLVVAGDSAGDHEVNSSRVETTQIAPTILRLLGLNPNALQAVQIEHTSALPLGDYPPLHTARLALPRRAGLAPGRFSVELTGPSTQRKLPISNLGRCAHAQANPFCRPGHRCHRRNHRPGARKLDRTDPVKSFR